MSVAEANARQALLQALLEREKDPDHIAAVAQAEQLDAMAEGPAKDRAKSWARGDDLESERRGFFEGFLRATNGPEAWDKWTRLRVVSPEDAASLIAPIEPDTRSGIEPSRLVLAALRDIGSDGKQRGLLDWLRDYVGAAKRKGQQAPSAKPNVSGEDSDSSSTGETDAATSATEAPSLSAIEVAVPPELWCLREPKRMDGLRMAIFNSLGAADNTKQPPRARDLHDSWSKDRPPQIARVNADSVDYAATNSDGEKSATLKQIQDRINTLVERLSPLGVPV